MNTSKQLVSEGEFVDIETLLENDPLSSEYMAKAAHYLEDAMGSVLPIEMID